MNQLPTGGGIAEKLGNTYEALWSILCMLEILEGKYSSMVIESLDTEFEKSEFILKSENGNEFWQIKKGRSGDKSWTIAALKREGILAAFYERTQLGEKCIFCSESQAGQLKDLMKCAQGVSDFEQFSSPEIQTAERKKDLSTISKELKADDLMPIFNFLKLLDVRDVDFIALGELIQIKLKLRYEFEGDLSTIMSHLRTFYEQNINNEISALNIENRILETGATKKLFSENDRAKVLAITESFISGEKSKLIDGAVIQIEHFPEAIKEIEGSSESVDVFLVGNSGIGKSAYLANLAEKLELNNFGVLALRLDQINPDETSHTLSSRFDLKHSIIESFYRANPEKELVVIIDQIDSVSAVSGRNDNLLSLVLSMIRDTLNIRTTKRLHLVLGTRGFDLKNDPRIKRLLSTDARTIELTPLSLGNVKTIFKQKQVSYEHFSDKELGILSSFQNVKMALRVLNKFSDLSLNNQNALFSAYWKSCYNSILPTWGNTSEDFKEALSKLVSHIEKGRKLSLITEKAEDLIGDELLQQLCSIGFLENNNQTIQFQHESLFDYSLVRLRSGGILKFVEELQLSQQELFHRQSLRQFLSYYRDKEYFDYIDAVEQILNSESIRPHLKVVCVQCCFEFNEPTTDEWNIFEPYIVTKYGFNAPIPEYNLWLTEIVWRSFNTSEGFLKYAFCENRRLQRWLHTIDNEHFEYILVAFLNASSAHEKEIYDTFSLFLDGGVENVLKIKKLCERLRLENFPLLFELMLQSFDKGAYDCIEEGIWRTSRFWTNVQGHYDAESSNILFVIKHWLKRSSKFSGEFKDEDLHKLYENRDNELSHYLMKASERFPEKTLECLFPSFLDLVNTRYYTDEKNEFKYSYAIGFIPYFGKADIFPNSLVYALSNSLKIFAKSDPNQAEVYVNQLIESKFYVCNYIVFSAFLGNPNYFSNRAISLFLEEPFRLDDGYPYSAKPAFFVIRQVLKACSKHCHDKNFKEIELFSLSYDKKIGEGKPTTGRLWRLKRDRYYLLEALDKERLSIQASKQLAVFERELSKPKSDCEDIKGGWVHSPILAGNTSKMSEGDWLQAFAKYDSEERLVTNFDDHLKGGARELARQFGVEIKVSPEKFQDLMMKCPINTHVAYLKEGISNLSIDEIRDDYKLALFERYKGFFDIEVIRSLISLIGSISLRTIPTEMVQYLLGIARYYQCPEPDEKALDKDLLNNGINTTRGSVAETVCHLVCNNDTAHSQLKEVIDVISNDASDSVRASGLMMLHALILRDSEQGITFLRNCLETDNNILTSRSLWHGLSRVCPKHFKEVEPILVRALDSESPEIIKEATRIICYYNAITGDAEVLLNRAKKDLESGMPIVIDVAIGHFHLEAVGDWSQKILLAQLASENDELADLAGSFIWTLRRENLDGKDYIELLEAYCKSKGSSKNVDHGIDYFTENFEGILPGSIIDFCQNAMNYGLSKEKGSSEYNRTLYELPELVFRFYRENKNRSSNSISML